MFNFWPRIQSVQVKGIVTIRILLASIILLMAQVPCVYPAKEESSTEAAPRNGEPVQQDDENAAADERKLPELEPGRWEPLFETGDSIYPSFVVSTATLKEGLWDDPQHIGDPWGIVGIAVRGDRANCVVSVKISGGNFVKPSIFTCTLPDKDTVYCVYPELKYDYEKLLGVKQTVPESFTFNVKIGDRASPEKIVRAQVRPINECVIYFTDSMGEIHDVSFLFAAYVNENDPLINDIMKEALDSKRVDSFSGTLEDSESVMQEIDAIWETLKNRGIRYSTIAASSDEDNPSIDTQHVRLLGESVNYTQANCVDGSVLLASILRKIGLDVSLVELPDHMFITVNLDNEGKDTIFIETTMLGDNSLEEAIEEGNKQYEEHKDKFTSEKPEDEAYNIINIQSARTQGVMPIKDTTARMEE